MKYYDIHPEVPGGFGENTVIDRSSGRMVVLRLYFEFDGWMGDDLVTSTPCFLVTDRLADEIRREELTGVRFDEVEVTKSEQFEEFEPECQLPKFVWLKVEGTAGRDDFGLAHTVHLVISERAFVVLKRFAISHAAVKPFEG